MRATHLSVLLLKTDRFVLAAQNQTKASAFSARAASDVASLCWLGI
jgi:hypothetical protein